MWRPRKAYGALIARRPTLKRMDDKFDAVASGKKAGDMPTATDLWWTTRLDRWAETPPHQTNVGLIAFTVLMMVGLLGATWDMPERAPFLRGVAMVFIGIHGVLHLLMWRALARLRARGLIAAERAFAAYRDPHRVTNLDLAIGWAGYAILISVLNALAVGPA